MIQKLYIENAGTNNPLQFLHLKYPVVRPPSITTINPAAKIVYAMHSNNSFTGRTITSVYTHTTNKSVINATIDITPSAIFSIKYPYDL